MSTARRNRYEKLLRWYPKSWRARSGSVILDTLEEHADAQGRTRITSGEAWSIRANGLMERATPAAIAALAGLAVLLSVLQFEMRMSSGYPDPVSMRVLLAATQFLSTLLASYAAGALIVRASAITAEQALFCAVTAIPAWAFGTLYITSWSLGFNDEDAETGMSWLVNAILLFFLAALALGTIALAPLFANIFRILKSPALRWSLALVLAVPCSLACGVLGFVPPGAILVAGGTLMIATRQLRNAEETESAHQPILIGMSHNLHP